MPLSSVEDVIELFERWGADHYDEEVSQLDHALQCAALARASTAAPSLVVASLLHDIGHLLDLDDHAGDVGDFTIDHHHELRGARELATLFPPEVTAPIALHVEAKRYCCAVDPSYLGSLSPGSLRSLATQGGPMTADEAARFKALPRAADAIALRRWDDQGKVDGLEVVPLSAYEGLLHSLALGD